MSVDLFNKPGSMNCHRGSGDLVWQTWRACHYFTYPLIEALDSLMGCDLGNICAKAERQTSEKSVNEN
jgi:hypothetical protein